MTGTDVRAPRSTVDRVARALTEIGAPWVINIVTSVILGAAIGAPEWGAFVAVCAGVVPMGVILIGMRRSRIGDHHVTKINERHLLIAVLLLVTIGGLVTLVVTDAPQQMAGFMAAGLIALAVAAIITSIFRWKVSFHTGVAAGVSVVLAIALSLWWLLGWAFTVLIGWSRVHLGDHTRGQVIVGALLGAIAAGLSYAMIV
ncbi:phosphatase PAP2 family protein [Rhodococcus rhodochrous]|uniref:Phosphatase PAP2 family protein n=1 Tax=Rhodococcus rhodochrous TaxID=1829 RepID=A0AA46X1A7_RHORH|nr:phosphatase PAP2 family protein [Rhodococcus rhodochrous]UZF48281.1 phosphatase PAP2 family protein [Rhodococcus rhodochrous]